MTMWAEVIGDPVAHSKSPLIHRFWLDALGIDGDYRAMQVLPDDLASFFDRRRNDPTWRGCNVTVSLKLLALDLVEDRGGLKDTIGATNTVLRADDGALIATNTDAAGFWAPIAGLELAGKSVTVVGAGGAARAVLFALAKAGVGPVTVMNRSALKAAGLLAHFGLKGDVKPLGSVAPPSALVVNASTLGMTGAEPLTLDLSAQDDDCVVYDLVYAPLETPLLAAAQAHGLETVDGLEMLVGQAAIAFELFFGAVPPRDCDEELRALLVA